MNKPIILLYILFLLSIFGISAQEAYVDYLEGVLEVQTTGSWQELYIGDEIPSNGRLKLSDNGYAELMVGNAVVSLTKDGSYALRDIVKGSSTVQAASFDLKKKLTLSTGHDKWRQEATMGVRGAEATVSTGTGMEDAYTYLEAGMDSMGRDDYDEALVNFEEGWEFFEDHNCLLFTAVCYEQLGEKRNYVRTLEEVDSSSLDREYKSIYGLRMGDLLIRSMDYSGALEVLDDLEGTEMDREESQQLEYLTGTAWLGAGNNANARSAFQKARDLMPSSELGKQAAEALSSL